MKESFGGLVLAGLCAVTIPLRADDADHTAPSYDMKAQSLVDLERVQKKFVDLANAVPADKLTWRPLADSRSFAEMFLHVAGERYGILGMMGATAPADFNGKTFEKSTTDRAKIIAELNRSWEFAKTAINGMTNADFAKLLPKLGSAGECGGRRVHPGWRCARASGAGGGVCAGERDCAAVDG